MAEEKIDIANLSKTIQNIGADIISDIIIQLKNKNKNASGKLLNSLKQNVRYAITSIILELEYEDYGLFVDQGRTKLTSFPPLKNIKQWCKVRGISEDKAFPIARNIYLFGIKPVNFVSDTLKVKQSGINDKIRDAATKDLQAKIELLTKEIK